MLPSMSYLYPVVHLFSSRSMAQAAALSHAPAWRAPAQGAHGPQPQDAVVFAQLDAGAAPLPRATIALLGLRILGSAVVCEEQRAMERWRSCAVQQPPCPAFRWDSGEL